MVRLLKILRSAKDRLLGFFDAPSAEPATEAPEELLNSGIRVLTRKEERIPNPESLARNRFNSNSVPQLQKVLSITCTAELSPAKFPTKDGFELDHHGLGVQSEKDEVDVKLKLQGVLSKLEVSQDFAMLARQLRQEGIRSVETLKSLVLLIFQNAVMHPTQCAMYAQLCVHLSQLELPAFPGDMKITIRRVLLNYCQEEFEKLVKAPEQAVDDHEKESKRVKLRTLGNVKLIGELFNEELLPEKLVHACIQELLGEDPKVTPAEENVEVLCHLFRTAGKQLHERAKSKLALAKYFARLKVIGESTALPSRIQGVVRGVFELRSMGWESSPSEVRKAMKINKAGGKAKLGLQPETVSLRKGRPAATSKFLPEARETAPGLSAVPSILGMPGLSVVPSILGTPGMPVFPSVPKPHEMHGSGAPVQLVDILRKSSADKKAPLSVPVTRDPVKAIKFGAGGGAAMPKRMAQDHFVVRANKDDYDLRDLLRRVQTFGK